MAVAAKIGIKVLTVAVGIPVGIVTKKAVEKAWLAMAPDDPPRKPRDAQVRWTDAITWAALSATGLVVADLVARRGAEEIYRTLIGHEPPVQAGKTPTKLKQAKAQKQLEKSEKRAKKR